MWLKCSCCCLLLWLALQWLMVAIQKFLTGAEDTAAAAATLALAIAAVALLLSQIPFGNLSTFNGSEHFSQVTAAASAPLVAFLPFTLHSTYLSVQ